MTGSLLLIVNARAGRASLERVEALLDPLRTAGYEPELFPSPTPEAAQERIRQHAGIGVLAVGGDGTVHVALQALDLARQTLGIIPLGSGNDVFRNLKLEHTPEAALAPVLAGTTAQWDIGTVGNLRFVNSAGVGLDSMTLTTRETVRNKWLRRDYSALFLLTLLKAQPFRVRLTLDDHEMQEERGWWYIVANGPFIGGGMHITPGGSVTDGQFEVLSIRDISKWALVQALPKVFKGAHLDLPGITVRHARRVRCEILGQPMRIAVDGELAMPAPVEFTLQPGALRVWSPPG